MFGNTLKQLRTEHKMTQKELGEKLNLSQRVIGYYEKDERFPDQITLIKIADFFNVSVDFLLGRYESEDYRSELRCLLNNTLDNPTDIFHLKSIFLLIHELLVKEGATLNGKKLDPKHIKNLRNYVAHGFDTIENIEEISQILTENKDKI